MGNVGIGTTNPTGKLEVAENGGGTWTSANKPTLFISNAGTSNAYYALGIKTNSGEIFSVTNAGNIGIGTTSPGAKLEIVTATGANAQTAIKFQKAGGYGDSWIETYYNTVSNYGLGFGVASSTKVVINQTGSVGIGTTNPTNRLHVSDTVEDYVAVIENLGTGTAKSGLWIKTKSSFTNAVAFKVTSGATDVPAFQVNAGQVRIGSGSIGQFDGVFYITGSSATLANFVTNNSSALFISGSGLVGIGTSTPSAKLHVSGGDAILNNAFIGEVPTYTAANAQFSHISRSGAGEYSFLSANDGTTYVNSKTGANIYFRVNNSNMVTITPSGSVGIGTTNPAAKLEVQNGDALIRTAYIGNISAFGTNYASFSHLARTGSGDYSFLSDSNGGTYVNAKASNIIYFRINNLDKIIINPSGDLLVGTATSTYNTSGRGVVQANGSSTAIFGLTTGGTDSGYLYHTGTDMQVWNTKAGYTAIGTSNAERMRISSAGDVQIGTTAYATVGGSGYLMVKNVIGIVPDNTANTNNRNWAIQANGQFSGSLDFVTSAASASFPNDAYRVSFTRTGGVVAASFTGSFSGSLSAPGSTTQVLYNNGGAIAAASNFVFSGSNVGIGITNPTAPLDTNGVRLGRSWALASRANIRLDSSGSAYPADILFGHTAAANQTGWDGVYWSLSSRANDASNKFYIYRGGGNPSGSSEEVIMALEPNGKVGIGTTSPVTQLQVVGGYISTKDNAAYGGAFLEGGNGITYFGSLGSDDIQLYTGGATKVTIKQSSGNVGIGTTSPAQKLEVAGQILMSGTTNASAYLGGIASSWSGNAQYPTLYGSDVSRWVMHINPHISYVVSGSNGYAGAMNGATVRFASDTAATTYWDHGIGVNSVGIDRYSIGRTGVSLMAISSSGNIGIGTTNPAVRLDYGNSLNQAFHLHTNTTDYYGFNMTQYDGQGYSTNIFSGNGGFIKFRTASGTTTHSTRVTITGAGAVGIGTTNPLYSLDINGTTRAPKLFLDRTTAAASGISWYSAAYYAWINYMSPAATTSAGPAANVTAPSGTLVTSWALRSYIENSSGYGWTFESAANTATPSVVAEIRASDGAAKFGGGVTAPSFTGSLSGTATTASYVLQAVSASYATYAATAGSSTTTTSASYAATSSYANNFTVAGTLTAQTLVVQTITSSIVYSSGSNIFGNSVANTQKFTGSLQVTGSTHYLLGDVGIGTTNPGAKLEVNGNIKLSSTVGATATPSYIWLGNDFSNGTTRDKLKIYLYNSGIEQYGFTVGSNADIQYHSNTLHDFYTANSLSLRINGSGNVGIGSTAPTQGKLVVNGGVYATSFTGSLFGTASYATNALSASYSLNTTSASYANNATSASYAVTATTATNVVGGANRVLFNNGADTTTTDANLTWNGATFNIAGTLTATVKSFIIDHPTKADKKLQYGVLEGPEHSVYVRGKLKNTNYIPLPDYWHALVHQDSITVNITAIGKKQDIWVNEVTEHGIYLGYEGNTIEYFYSVFAERKDIGKLITEFDKEV